jgi:membrane-associated phospholipid phosphatase
MDALLITLIADGAVIPVVLIGAWALLFKVPKGSRYQAYCRILLAGLTAYAAAKLIASVYQPEVSRPFELMGVAAGASFLNNPGFPSDHVLFCVAITLAVWFETRSKPIALILVVLTALVGLGRVLALVHSPLDVIGGVAIASLGALWYLQRNTGKEVRSIRHWSKPQKAGKIA